MSNIIEGLQIVAEKEYHQSEGVSKSSLDHINKSPQHYKHAMENPMEPTPAMAFGSLFHCLNLEPDRMSEEYAVAPDVDKRTKAGKAAHAEFLIESEGKIAISQKDMDLAEAMTEAVGNHDLANDLMSQDGINEHCVYSLDKDTGLLKRGRMDRICEDAGQIIDLKTTTDASYRGFRSSVYKFNYHVQASFYMDLCREQNIDIDTFIFVCVEKVKPYAVAVYELDDEMIADGRLQYKQCLKKLAGCLKTDVWPSYSDNLQTIKA